MYITYTCYHISSDYTVVNFNPYPPYTTCFSTKFIGVLNKPKHLISVIDIYTHIINERR